MIQSRRERYLSGMPINSRSMSINMIQIWTSWFPSRTFFLPHSLLRYRETLLLKARGIEFWRKGARVGMISVLILIKWEKELFQRVDSKAKRKEKSIGKILKKWHLAHHCEYLEVVIIKLREQINQGLWDIRRMIDFRESLGDRITSPTSRTMNAQEWKSDLVIWAQVQKTQIWKHNSWTKDVENNFQHFSLHGSNSTYNWSSNGAKWSELDISLEERKLNG